jgi:predicted nuclease of predicted toxin-antitoxin system
MNLLFDEQCTGNYFANKAEIDKLHKVICIGHHLDLPAQSKDEKILEYAKKNDYTIVTKDVRFVKLCHEQNGKVAVVKGNSLFLIDKVVKMFGKEPENRLFTPD